MRLPRIPIVKDVIPYLVTCIVLAIAAYLLMPLTSLIPLTLLVIIAFFFRDPDRKTPHLPDALIAPADGRIIEIKEVFEEKFLDDVSQRVSIFLSLFDVHVVRSPSDGKVGYISYEKGRFRPAFHKLAPHENEKNFIGICNSHAKVLMTQVAGMLARRIVCYVKEGDTLVQGQRVGLIKFGSRVDIYIPTSVEITVSKGQRVRAGETIIGRFKTEIL
ncbi:phosphatidylserine decarboxylase family protein [Chloroflexota bacterium]